MTKKKAKKATKRKASKKAPAKPQLERSEDGNHDKLPDMDHYKLLFFASAVEAAKNKLNEQRISYDLWRLETARKQEVMKATVKQFAVVLRDKEVLYNSYLAELANKYGIEWTKVALQDDGTIIILPDEDQEALHPEGNGEGGAEESKDGDGGEPKDQTTKDGG